MKYNKIKDITPEEMSCFIGQCPAIYEGLKELIPEEMSCFIGQCSSVYEATRKDRDVYLIVGKIVNPNDAGLEKKVGKGEALIEVPRALIEDKGK